MSDTKSDDLLLLIRCPSCGQRFKVGEDLRSRTVECGACEHRFRINDDVIVRGKKFYPGERQDARLERFHRVPLAMASPVIGMQTVRYNEPPDPADYEPASPQRIIAGIIGVCLMVIMALLFMFGARRGAMLDGMITSNRLLMAGFTGLLGTVLLVYANRRGRGKALAFGVLSSAGLIVLPLVFTAGSVPLGSEPPPVTDSTGKEAEPDAARDASNPGESEEISALRKSIGTEPLEEENQRLQLAGSTHRAIGLWLRDMRGENRYLIKDYIVRVANADPESHYFPRGRGDFLLRVTGIGISIDELAKLAAPLGTVERVYPEIDVIEVKVNNDNFIEGPIEKLNNRDSPQFYDLNKRELDSIDLTRVEKAVKRLAEAEPKLYRSDITRSLNQLLGTPQVNFKGDICRALVAWSETPGPASDAALREIKKMMSHGVAVPMEMVELVLHEKNAGLLPVIHDLWEQNPRQWESLYGEVGGQAEQVLLRRFPTAEGSQRHSIVRLLGKIGSPASLPMLESSIAQADSELRVLLEKAAHSIRERGTQ